MTKVVKVTKPGPRTVTVEKSTETVEVDRLRTNVVEVIDQGPIGITGPQGPQGVQGPVGPAGPAGPQGPAPFTISPNAPIDYVDGSPGDVWFQYIP